MLHKAAANLGGTGEIVGLHKYGSHIAPLASLLAETPPQERMLSIIMTRLRESR
jgi:hypothetical protein